MPEVIVLLSARYGCLQVIDPFLHQTGKIAPDYYRLHLAYGEYYLLLGDMKKAQDFVDSGKKCAANEFEKTELLMLEAKIRAASGKWAEAKELQKNALQNINNSFSEIRIAYQNYAEYCLKNNDIAEAKKTIGILKSIDRKHPDVIDLEKRLKTR